MNHGGNIKAAAAKYGMQAAEMVDLSTGISPRAYPLDMASLSAEMLIDLPQAEDASQLMNIMAQVWSVPDSVAIALAPGSGLLINLLPRLCREHYAKGRSTVLCPQPVYSEHVAAWQAAGFTIKGYSATDIPDCHDPDIAAIIAVQPGNPLGNIRPSQDWQALFDHASQHDVMIVMDEAFIDLYPDKSVVPLLGHSGQVVIRSLGKFYGLAGLRLGAALGHPDDMSTLNEWMGPWAVSTLALRFGAAAIGDVDWAKDQRHWLAGQMRFVTSAFEKRQVEILGHTDLYCLISVDDAAALQDHLARAGFWTRIFAAQPQWMRIGLPLDSNITTRFFDAFDSFQAAD